jgi:hypothetical protein
VGEAERRQGGHVGTRLMSVTGAKKGGSAMQGLRGGDETDTSKVGQFGGGSSMILHSNQSSLDYFLFWVS